MSDFTKYAHARLNDRQVTELIGISRGLLADGYLSDQEVEYLHKWLVAQEGLTRNPLVAKLATRLDEVLADGIVDDDERAELLSTLVAFTGSDFELGEATKAGTLPLCAPAPDIVFPDARFTFTGAFVFGKRRDCEAAVIERGATAETAAQGHRIPGDWGIRLRRLGPFVIWPQDRKGRHDARQGRAHPHRVRTALARGA